MSSYGFPLPWYAASGVGSMAYTIAIGPLLLDLLAYLLLCQIAMTAVLRGVPDGSRIKPILSIALWLLALSSLAFTLLALSIGADFAIWQLDSYFGSNANRSYYFQLGPGK